MDGKTISGVRVIELIMEGEDTNRPGKKAAATRLLQAYVKQQAKLGKSPIMIEAGIRSHITKRRNLAKKC